jgi:hypothetical protein
MLNEFAHSALRNSTTTEDLGEWMLLDMLLLSQIIAYTCTASVAVSCPQDVEYAFKKAICLDIMK